MTTPFSELGIRQELVAGLSKLGIETPTPIQVAALPKLLERGDTYLQAETGTGKTLAYLLPLISRINPELASTQIIIVAPTHELAIQIQRQCADLCQHSALPLRILLLIGGTSRDRQLEKLKKKPHIVVGSAGRIKELIADGKVKTATLKAIVVDEADRMLAAESLADIRSIARAAPKDRSLIFVSATEHAQSSEALTSLSPELTRINAASSAVNADIEHLFLVCEERDKPELVRKAYHAMKPERAIVFTHRKETAEIVSDKLAHHKLRVADLHGAHDKEDRKRAMDSIRSGKVDLLIASDVAARGLDIQGVTHVFNLDTPTESSAYLHRAGRTGRAGTHGVTLSFIALTQRNMMKRFERELGIVMTEVYLREGRVLPVEVDGR